MLLPAEEVIPHPREVSLAETHEERQRLSFRSGPASGGCWQQQRTGRTLCQEKSHIKIVFGGLFFLRNKQQNSGEY